MFDSFFVCCNPGTNSRKRQQILIQEAIANSNATIQREMEIYNKTLQKCLIAKATKKQIDMIPDTPCIASRLNVSCCVIMSSSSSSSNNKEDENDDDDDRSSSSKEQQKKGETFTGWIEFKCGKAIATASTNGKSTHSSCDGHDHTISGFLTRKDVDTISTSENNNNNDITTIQITKGKWSPTGFCYWIEDHYCQQTTNENAILGDRNKNKNIIFVVHNFNEPCPSSSSSSSYNQTMTTFLPNGTKQRQIRTMKIINTTTNNNNTKNSSDTTASPIQQCPSISTVFKL